jgi:hypothetical protein
MNDAEEQLLAILKNFFKTPQRRLAEDSYRDQA